MSSAPTHVSRSNPKANQATPVRDDLREANTREAAEAIRSFRQGNSTGLARFIELTQDRLFRFCMYLTGDTERASELCQDAFLKAIRSLDRLQDPAKVYSWLFTIARNHFTDSFRGDPGPPAGLDEQELETILAESVEQSDRERVIQTQGALASLSPDDRALLVLIHLEGHSYQEVSEIVGIKESLVRSRVHAARGKFLKIYDAE